MSENNEDIYDLVVIGAGPGGYHSALRAAQFDAKVALIEKDFLGGTCTNWGCIPTKALYSSAKLIEEIHEKAAEFGVDVPCEISPNFPKAVERKNKIVDELRVGIKGLLDKQGVDTYMGFGKIEGGDKESGFAVSVKTDDETKTLKAKRVLIATGSTPALIPAFNIDHDKILTSDDILGADFTDLPNKMLIIGAGVIGCEFGNIFRQFGVEVELLEYLPSMLATEEKLVIKEMEKRFDALDMTLHTNQNVLKVEATENGVKATTCSAKVPRDEVASAEKSEYEADLCLVSIGRSKVASGIGFQDLGGKMERRAIWANKETMETSIPGIYAIGDVNSEGLMLAHVASHQGDIAVANLLTDIGGFDIHARKGGDAVVPYTIFTSPEIGTVGLNRKLAKKKAKESGAKLYTGRFYYNALGKAKCMGEENGFLMIHVNSETDEIYGATCIGHEAPELISEIALAMQNGITATQVGHTIHSHPTISEMVLEAAEDAHGLAIHRAGRRK